MSVESTLAIPADRSKSQTLSVAALVLFTLSWFAVLGSRALYDPDEARYAEIPREMLVSGNWVIPHLDGLAYLEKPPLQYWITALSFQVFGETEFAARLWTALCGYSCIVIVYLLARRLWGANAALRAAAMLIGAALFSLLAHQITLDMSLTFWLLAALACFIQAQLARERMRENRRWMLGCWIAMGAAVLTKGLIGVVIPAATVIGYGVLQRDYPRLDKLNLRWGLPVFAAITLPWFVLAARANPAFLEFFFVHEHFQRFLTKISQRVEPWWFFIAVLVIGVLPWLGQALRAIFGDWRRRTPLGRFDVVRLLWVWAGFVLIFFSVSDSKLVPYILPAVPALAMLCARHEPRADTRMIKIGVALSLLASIGVLAYAGSVFSPHSVDSLATAFRAPLLAMACAIALTGALALHLLRRRRAQAALIALCLGWFGAYSVMLVGHDAADSHFSSRELAGLLRQHAAAGDPVFSVGCYDQSVPFYSRRTVTLAAYRGELDFGLTQASSLGIGTIQEFASRWRSLPQGYALMEPGTFAKLASEGMPLRELGRNPTLVLASRR